MQTPKQRHLPIFLPALTPSSGAESCVAHTKAVVAVADALKKNPKTIVVASAWEYGLSIASIAAANAVKSIVVLPEGASPDLVNMLTAVGAEIVRTPRDAHSSTSNTHVETARRIAEHSRDAVLIVESFLPLDYAPVAKEIYNQAKHALESAQEMEPCVVVHVTSIDELSAWASALASAFGESKRIKTVGIVIGSDAAAWKHLPLPGNTELKIVTEKEAYIGARAMMRNYGIFGGIHSGAAGFIANQIHASSPASVTISVVSDSAHTYNSTLLNPQWLLDHEIFDPAMLNAASHKYRNASVEDLQLPECVTISTSNSVAQAMDVMLERDFSQLPVINRQRRVVGLVSLARLNADIASGAITDFANQPVIKHMYTFAKTEDPFKVITPDTPLSELEAFFETHPAAIVTDASAKFPLAIVTKLDLIRFLSKRGIEQ